MTANNESASWYRVADIKPQLQDHISIHRHEYRHHAWFVLQDRHTARSHRFNATAWFVISCMNGRRSMQELYEITTTKFPDAQPSQDELIALLGKLYTSELIKTNKVPDIDELSQRGQKTQKLKILQYLRNPMAMRFKLLNPDKLLDRVTCYTAPFFRKKFLYAWISLLAVGAMLSFTNWPELTNAARLHTFNTQNILLIVVIYPLIKLIHESGHALAIKRFGGEVSEMGIMLMVFVPIPYVNAHSAIAFSDKHQRMLVSAMGIIIETSLAVMALFIWLLIEPGLLRSICLDIMLIGGISTLFINGNPLLKYDGYHIFADAIEAPNMASRSKKYLSYKLHQYLFKIEKGDTGLISESERGWFLTYAVAAFIYRIFIMLFILGMLLDRFFALGIVLASWVLTLQVVLPSLRYIHYLVRSEQLASQRRRVNTVIVSIGLVLLIGLFIVPVPQTSSTEGIIWLSKEMQIKARAPGFIRKVLVNNNQHVEAGEPLIITEDPLLAGRVRVLTAQLRELQVKLNAQRDDHLEVEKLKQDIASLNADIILQKERLASLLLASPAAGRLVIPDVSDLPDRFVQAGQLLGFILDPDYIVAQVILSEDEIALFNSETSEFEIRPVSQPDRRIGAQFKRLLPEAITQLPSAALGVRGGGKVLVDPQDPSGRKTIDKVFQLELSLSNANLINYIGNRVYVRVRHQSRPLALQWGRALQQLLLGRFNV